MKTKKTKLEKIMNKSLLGRAHSAREVPILSFFWILVAFAFIIVHYFASINFSIGLFWGLFMLPVYWGTIWLLILIIALFRGLSSRKMLKKMIFKIKLISWKSVMYTTIFLSLMFVGSILAIVEEFVDLGDWFVIVPILSISITIIWFVCWTLFESIDKASLGILLISFVIYFVLFLISKTFSKIDIIDYVYASFGLYDGEKWISVLAKSGASIVGLAIISAITYALNQYFKFNMIYSLVDFKNSVRKNVVKGIYKTYKNGMQTTDAMIKTFIFLAAISKHFESTELMAIKPTVTLDFVAENINGFEFIRKYENIQNPILTSKGSISKVFMRKLEEKGYLIKLEKKNKFKGLGVVQKTN